MDNTALIYIARGGTKSKKYIIAMKIYGQPAVSKCVKCEITDIPSICRKAGRSKKQKGFVLCQINNEQQVTQLTKEVQEVFANIKPLSQSEQSFLRNHC